MDIDSAPMVFPYLTDDVSLKQRLIDNKVFVATYWPNVLEWCGEVNIEHFVAKNICFLPIDQRYGEENMKAILDTINITN